MTVIRCGLGALVLGLLAPEYALAQGEICPRPGLSAVVAPPPDIYARHGVAQVSFNYNTTLDSHNHTLFCFQTPDGKQSPTIHAKPGDTVQIALTNTVLTPSIDPVTVMKGPNCASNLMFSTSVNMHFHGLNISPQCGSDEVIHTLVNSGQEYTYALHIPKDEPPGLYWYHPHVHGVAEAAVQGGASGLIEVEGIANIQPEVSGLPQRYLDIRDQLLIAPARPSAPSWDVSLNYVPVPFPYYPPARIQMNPGTREFWRVGNTSADTIIDLQLTYDGAIQPLTIEALDGVPVGSQDGTRKGKSYQVNDILLPPAGRAEFIVDAPARSVKKALLSTLAVDTGPTGDSTPARPLATIELTNRNLHLPRTPDRWGPPNPQRFEDLANAKVTAKRTLYFDEHEISHDGATGRLGRAPESDTNTLFYITVKGQREKLFDPNEKPAIVTTQGAVEDWTIQNRTLEPHEFHMHQIHFVVLAVNGVPVPKNKQQFYDTFQVPYGTGKAPYPSIKVRMDFRGAVAGDFVYHCHILGHEDQGMMAIIRVKPKA